MNAVIADQSAATGFAPSLISGVERGAHSLPAGYLEKLAEWLELDNEETAELALLATLRPTIRQDRVEGGPASEESLATILDRLSVHRSATETVDETR